MLPAHRVIGHKEYGNTPPGGWPGRKRDPAYDMNWRRARVAAFTPRTADPEDDMPSAHEVADAVVARLLAANNSTVGDTLLHIEQLVADVPQAVADYPVTSFDPAEKDQKRPAWSMWSNASVAATRATVEAAGLRAAIQALAEARGDLDVDALLTRVDATVRDAMSDTVKVSVSVDAGRDDAP